MSSLYSTEKRALMYIIAGFSATVGCCKTRRRRSTANSLFRCSIWSRIVRIWDGSHHSHHLCNVFHIALRQVLALLLQAAAAHIFLAGQTVLSTNHQPYPNHVCVPEKNTQSKCAHCAHRNIISFKVCPYILFVLLPKRFQLFARNPASFPNPLESLIYFLHTRCTRLRSRLRSCIRGAARHRNSKNGAKALSAYFFAKDSFNFEKKGMCVP